MKVFAAAGIVGASAAAAAIGYGVLQLLPHADGHYIEAFAASAVLAMLADSMMPESFEMGGELTGLALALGFAAAGSISLTSSAG
jgi:ZIP family zinc transporter